MKEIYDINEIMKFIPHRYPFIMIDRIVELERGKRIVALKNVTMNEPYFQGHFPGTPVMPGVMIVEAMGQAGGVLVIESQPERLGSLIYFMGFDKVRFRKPVMPGDQLLLDLTIIKLRSKAVKLSAFGTVDGDRVVEAELLAIFGD